MTKSSVAISARGLFFLAALLFPVTTLSSSLEARAPAPFTTFNNNPVFFPGSDYTSWRTLYARSLQLPDDSLLMTWENYPPEPPAANFPIYKSTDGGATWNEFSSVQDQVNGWGLRYQPHLYALPQDFGGYSAGTILISGPSAPQDLSASYIDLYASTDSGLHWEFVSHIAKGGRETATNGDDAIWEPFFLMYEGQLICYYSDQRDDAHGQKLVHVTTSDLRSWSELVNDVAEPTYTDRPGMTTVAHIESTNKFIMTYEWGGGAVDGDRSSYSFPVYYKVSDSPLTFGDAQPIPLISNDTNRIVPNGNPYIIWTPKPGATDGSGILIANGNSEEAVFVNEDAADVNGWKLVDVGQWSAYSRSLKIIRVRGEKKLLLANGGNMGPGDRNWVAVGVVDIPT